MTDIDTLIRDLEAADGSRELDGEIFALITLYPSKHPKAGERVWTVEELMKPQTVCKYDEDKCRDKTHQVPNGLVMGEMFQEMPHYTTSLDAALTLVPEGWAIVCWSNTPKGIGIQIGKKSVMFKGGSEQAEMRPGSTILDDQPFLVRGAHRTTPALALTIAALKARSAA